MNKLTIATPGPAVNNSFFGREAELDFLLKSLEGFKNSNTSLLLVEGANGIGKTTLIENVLLQYKKNKCFSLYGKFSNQSEKVPYLAFKQALKAWFNQILVLSEEELNILKDNAFSALQNNIITITSVFEELEQFFGQKQLNILPPVATEAHQIRSKFYYFFNKFLKSISHSGYQIIIFLDDLQWTDHASWTLLEEIVTQNAVPDLIIIGVYRPFDEKNDLQLKVRNLIEQDSDKIISYLVEPLDDKSISLLIPLHWKFTQEEAATFNKYLWYETEGNPFKIKEIIKSIEKQGLIRDKSDNDFWKNLPRFDQTKSSENFIRKQLQILPPHQQRLISAASCVGFYFNSEVLIQILNYPENEIGQILDELTSNDLLIKKDQTYLFTHDNIFSAANGLLTDIQKLVLHKKTGQAILSGLSDYQQNNFFLAINNLNIAWELEKSKCKLNTEHILLNIQAARLAIKNSAFDRALKYLSFADQLFKQYRPDEIIIRDAKLLDLFEKKNLSDKDLEYMILFGYAEIMFLLQKFDKALFFSNEVLRLKINRHQKILATLIKIRICSALIYKKDVKEILLDGMNSLNSVLNDFGLAFPEDPDESLRQATANSRKIHRRASGITEKTDFNALINPDREYQDLMNLVVNSMTFVYYMDVRKNLFLGIKFLLLSFTDGLTPITPVLFSVSFLSASISSSHLNMAFLLGKISLRMIERAPFSKYAHIVYYVATLNFFAWENHYKICIKKLKESVLLAKEAGDHHYASFCATNILFLNTYRGQNLKKHILYSKKSENKYQYVFFISSSDSDLTSYLAGTRPGFLENKFNFSEALIRESEYNLSGRFHLNLALQKLHYLSGNYPKALEAGYVCENLEDVYRGFQIKLEHYLFFCLSILQTAYENSSLLPESLEKVIPKLNEFKRLSAYGSGNYFHKALLIEAEIAKCKGEFETATLLYDRAIQEAKKQKFIHHAAIAAELAGEYYERKGRHKLASVYLNDALRLYSGWGADAKTEWLYLKYPFLTTGKSHLGNSPLPDYKTIINIINKTDSNRKLNLKELGRFLLSNLVEQSMAQFGALLVHQENIWKLLLTTKPELSEIEDRQLLHIESELPCKVLNYSINKSEKILLKNVQHIAHFADDPYFIHSNPENIYCYPISYGLEMVGLIYLENTDIDHIKRNDLFTFLIQHTSIALANAIYYESLHRLNQELKIQEQKKIEAVIESQEKERTRIAEELHDSVGQMLALVKLNLSRIEAAADQSGPCEINLVQQTSQFLDESIIEVRTISHRLMPPDLKSKSITEIAENLLKRNVNENGLVYQFHAFGVSEGLSEAVKFTIYRIIQEIIHNILKHAFAKQIIMSITQTDEGINLMVEDDGKGFDKNLVETGLGLKNIHSRVKLLNGFFDVDSSVNRGAIYNVTIPLKS